MPELAASAPPHPTRPTALLLVLALAGMVVFSKPSGNFPLQEYDKELHLAVFTVITMITAWALPTVRLSRLLPALVALSGLTELIQALPLVGREADWLDFAFNGIAIGATVCIIAAVRWIAARRPAART